MSDILSDDDLFNLTETVWSSMLGLELTRAELTDGKIGDITITACVQITGDWEGAVTVACAPSLAAKLAAAMFATDPADVDNDEIRDAVGEIANMAGGNVKGVVPGVNTLTLPTVAEGSENALSITRTTLLNRVVGISEGEPVIISILAKKVD